MVLITPKMGFNVNRKLLNKDKILMLKRNTDYNHGYVSNICMFNPGFIRII